MFWGSFRFENHIFGNGTEYSEMETVYSEMETVYSEMGNIFRETQGNRQVNDYRSDLILGHSSSVSAHENGGSRIREQFDGSHFKKFRQNWPHTLVRPEKNFVLN